MITYHEQTVKRYYAMAMVELQELIPVAQRPKKLRIELRKRRPRYYRKKIWNEAIVNIIYYTRTHRNNFVDGQLVA